MKVRWIVGTAVVATAALATLAFLGLALLGDDVRLRNEEWPLDERDWSED